MTGHEPPPPAEGGFTIVETSVALAIVGLVMASLTSFFVTTMRITRQQNDTEGAVQVSTAAMSRVRSIKGSSLVYGRDAASSHQQWNNPVAGVAPHLSGSVETWDDTAASGRGPLAALPTTPQPTTADLGDYQQSWYVGECWQNVTTGVCDTTKSKDDLHLLRVVVAVTWADVDCAAGVCSYVRSTLVSPADDPVFILNQ